MSILILEDDIALCKGIELTLNAPGREFTSCHTIAAANEALQKGTPELFLLDINLPDGSGLDFCEALRSAGYVAPVLMLTANDTELDTVIGLTNGADDYMTKPFSLAVLRARVDALLRRGTYDKIATADGFVFDFGALRFEKNGQPLELSKTEARLLQLLFTNRGQTLTREQLSEQIWPDGTEYVDENALSVAIRRLRAKVEDEPSNPRFIKTVHGIGYKWTQAHPVQESL
ncbi:MAG: response regulator transcription factor [Clostridiales Family XIII bacterium]|jgi:DNA-binding response OmpR family regulator|nr:response regulator transcription factor [Clostridiales Family XIII bacterium]